MLKPPKGGRKVNMIYKYRSQVGTKEYNSEKQKAYMFRKHYNERFSIWKEVVDKIYDMEKKGLTYREIAEELANQKDYMVRKAK